jgi:hypothetical protein
MEDKLVVAINDAGVDDVVYHIAMRQDLSLFLEVPFTVLTSPARYYKELFWQGGCCPLPLSQISQSKHYSYNIV